VNDEVLDHWGLSRQIQTNKQKLAGSGKTWELLDEYNRKQETGRRDVGGRRGNKLKKGEIYK